MVIEREKKLPRDYEVMDSVLERGDAKELALRLHVSPQLVRGWCREPELENSKASGKFNPLARIRTLCAMIRETDGDVQRAEPIAHYVANLAGGTFVPRLHYAQSEADFVKRCANILKETGQAIEAVNDSYFDDESPKQFTLKEQEKCCREIDEALAALLQMRDMVVRG